MAAIGILDEVVDVALGTNTTSSTTFSDVDATNLQIDAADWSGVGAEYIVEGAIAVVLTSSTNKQVEHRVASGSTPDVFPNSLGMKIECRGNERGFSQHVVFKYTVPDPAVDLRWQHKSTTGTSELDTFQGYIRAIPIDNFDADDYGYVENTSSTALTTSLVDFASLTKTVTAADKWVTLGCFIASSISLDTKVNWDTIRSGSALGTDTSSHQFETRSQPSVSGWPWQECHEDYSAESTTLKIAAKAAATSTHSHEFSSIFWFNASKICETITRAVSAGPTTLTPIDTVVDLVSLTHNPATAGNQFVYGSSRVLDGTPICNYGHVLDDNGTQFPTNPSTANYGYASEDTADDVSIAWAALRNITGSRTLKFQSYDTRHSDATASRNHLFAFSDEAKPAVGGGIEVLRRRIEGHA